MQLQLNASTPRVHQEEACYLVQISAIDEFKPTGTTQPLHSDISALLSHYQDIYATPTELPPTRKHDHHIPLKPNSSPVNSHPYRCPIAQREEIEKITKEMLAAGVIRTISSPFASPVLLVKKKDNTWRLVVDYRAYHQE